MLDSNASGLGIKQIVIKSDSAYLVNGIVKNIQRWRLNNYTTARGRPIANNNLICYLDERITILESRGVSVRFWHVLRMHNKQADKLTRAAADGVDWRQFTREDLVDL